MGRTHIDTERLALRPVTPEDEAAVLAALDDIQVVRWLAVVPFPYRPEHFRAWQPTAQAGETWAVDTPGGLIGVIGLTEVEDDAPAVPLAPVAAAAPEAEADAAGAPQPPNGSDPSVIDPPAAAPAPAEAPPPDEADTSPAAHPTEATAPRTRLELGYWFARASWGRGYATEAVGAVVAAHFADPAAPPLTAHVHDGNIRSESVLRRIGFQTVGPRRYYAEALKREVDATTLRATRADWLAANPIAIGTERLLIDPLTEADAPAFRRLVTYPAVGRNLFLFPPDWTDAAARRFIADWRWQGEPPYRLAIRLRGAGGSLSLIGMIGIAAGPAPEIFYAIDPVHGRGGLMTEALAAFVDEVIRRHAPPALTARVFTDNSASARLLEKAGFARQPGEAMVKSAARPDPAPVWTYRRSL